MDENAVLSYIASSLHYYYVYLQYYEIKTIVLYTRIYQYSQSRPWQKQ